MLERLSKVIKSFDSNEIVHSNHSFRPITQILPEAGEQMHNLFKSNEGRAVTGLPTGFIDIDNFIFGLQKGQLIVIAGRPSMGKASFSLCIAQYVALIHGGTVAIFSMKRSGNVLTRQMVGALKSINRQKLRTGKLSNEDWKHFQEGLAILNKAKIYINDECSSNIKGIQEQARALKIQLKSLDIIIIDDLQHLIDNSLIDEAQQKDEVDRVSQVLKSLANELNIPIVVLSNLHPCVETRENKHPKISDLRDYLAIEKYSDTILLLHRDEAYYKSSLYKDIALIIIAKQKHGQVGSVNLLYFGEYNRFENFRKINIS